MEWFLKLFENGSLQDEIFATVLVGVLVLLSNQIVKGVLWIWRRVAQFFSARSKLRRLYREITRTRMKGRWSRPVGPVDRKLQRRIGDSIPILLFANQKGGVGKTTLAANLGAYFALRRQMKVLFVDLDFQGTLSATLLNMANLQNLDADAKPRLLDVLLTDYRRYGNGEMTPAQALAGQIRQCPPVRIDNNKVYPGNFGFSGFIDAGSALGDLEDWLMLKWVAKLDRADVRFQLARFLHSQELQSSYDIVILDAPPRNTTAGINGLCAATHVLIPSRADRFSWNGARRYLEEVTVEHENLAPHVKMAGFVGTMMASDPKGETPTIFVDEIKKLETEELVDPKTRVRKPIASYWPSGSSFSYLGNVRTSVAFTEDTNVTISYLTSKPVRDLIEPIGDKLFETLFPANET